MERGILDCVMKTPASSPDLNPIENVWASLKYYLQTVSKPRTRDQLVDGIQNFWLSLTKKQCGRYIDHIHKVMPYVVLNSGEASGFWGMNKENTPVTGLNWLWFAYASLERIVNFKPWWIALHFINFPNLCDKGFFQPEEREERDSILKWNFLIKFFFFMYKYFRKMLPFWISIRFCFVKLHE